MKPEIIHKDESLEYETPERCSILELSNHGSDPDVSIARARVATGVTTAWHHLEGVAERYIIQSGRGCVEVGELGSKEVGPGDVVRIPAGVRQRICNTGSVDLVFLAICTPRFVSGCYTDLEACE